MLKVYRPEILNTYVPIKIEGDGNCLFRAVSLALYGNQKEHERLRFLSLVEIIENKPYYAPQSK